MTRFLRRTPRACLRGIWAVPTVLLLGLSIAIPTEALVPGAALPGPTFPITVTESGLPVGTGWTAAIFGNHQTSRNSTIVFQEPDGQYLVNIFPVPGYDADTSAIPVTVQHAPASATVNFTKNNTPPPTDGSGDSGTPGPSGTIPLGLIVGLAVVGVLGAICLYYLFGRPKSRSEAEPPEPRRHAKRAGSRGRRDRDHRDRSRRERSRAPEDD